MRNETKTKLAIAALMVAISLSTPGCIVTAIAAGGGALAYEAYQTHKRVDKVEEQLNVHEQRIQGVEKGVYDCRQGVRYLYAKQTPPKQTSQAWEPPTAKWMEDFCRE